MEDLTGVELSILVSSNGFDLAVPKLIAGTERAICDDIQTINEWYLKEDIKAFGFDTIAVSTERLNGVCEHLNQNLIIILYLACHHYIHEIMPDIIFITCMGA